MKIFVSRHQLTECPSCQAHIRVADKVAETTCPFCDAVLGQALAQRARPSLGSISRTSLMAGALLGLSVIPGCDDGDDPQPQPVYGVPADVIVSDAASDSQPAPLYGEPADIQVDTAPDFGPQPEYGVPAPDAQ